MNTTCPQCGSPYNVTEAHVGRKFTCKKCNTPVVVGPNGLDYQDAPVAPAAAPPPAAPPRARDDWDDGGGYPDAGRPARRPGGGGGEFVDILTFRKLVVRAGIPVIFWVLSGLIVAYGLYYGISGISSGIGLIVRASLELLFIYTPLGVVFVRIFCEVLVLLFRISDTLTEIKNGQDRQAR